MSLSALLDLFKLNREESLPAVSDQEQTNYQKAQSNQRTEFGHVLFEPFIDANKIMGREESCYSPEYSAQNMYLQKLWNLSKEVTAWDNVYPKRFFDAVDELEHTLYDCPFIIANYDQNDEIRYYESRKEQLMVDFVNRAFKECFRHALTLKTSKGRVGNVENWFLQMEYYKQFMPDKAKLILDSLKNEWNNELIKVAERQGSYED